MARDNFAKATIEILAKRVGNNCSNPNCHALTCGPNADPSKATNLGVAAHITAASEGGPRYNPSLSSEKRKSISNAIWLCQNCAKLIDSDETLYSVQVLNAWKERAENAAWSDLGRTSNSNYVSIRVPELPTHFLKRSKELNSLRNLLLTEVKRVTIGGTSPVGLHGMGGIGKSVLAAAAARDDKIIASCHDGVYWITIGRTTSLVNQQIALAKSLGDSKPTFTNVEDGKMRLRELVAEKNLLLILDDVWALKPAEVFLGLGDGCHILITTRDASILTRLNAVEQHIDVLRPKMALRLLAEWIGNKVATLPEAAGHIAAECGYLPLALSTCGAMVRDGVLWTDLLAALREADLSYLDESLGYPYRDVFRSVQVGVQALAETDSTAAERYKEFAVFTEGKTVPEATVAMLWEYTGNLKNRDTRKLLARLERKALLRLEGPVTDRQVVLHDLQRDYLKATFSNLRELHSRLLDAYMMKCTHGWPSGPDDKYFFQHLCHHFCAAERSDELVTLLYDLRWLEAKSKKGLLFDLISDFGEAQTSMAWTDPRRRILQLLEEALCRDMNFIARHIDDYPQALFQCLWNTCWWYDCPQSDLYYRQLTEKVACNDPPLGREKSGLFELLELWRKTKVHDQYGFSWFQSLRPPKIPLGTAQVAVMRGQGEGITCVSCSHDGQHVASAFSGGLSDGMISVWDAKNTREVLRFCGHTGWVTCVSYSPDDRYIVSGGHDGTVRIWDALKGVEIRCLQAHRDHVNCVCFTPDGSQVASGSGGRDGTEETIRIWDVKSGKELICLRGHTSFVEAVSFSSDGLRIVSASVDGTIRIWNAKDGKQLHCMNRKSHGKTAAFSPDDRHIVSGGHDQVVRIWDAETGVEVRSLKGHEHTIMCVAYSNDGRHIVSGAVDKTVRVWDAASGNEVCCLRGHNDSVESVAFSPDGVRVFSGSGDGTIRAWRIDRTTEFHQWMARDQYRPFPSPDGRFIAVSSKGYTIRVTEVNSGKDILSLRGHTDHIQCKAFSIDGELLASGSSDRTVRIWDMQNGNEIKCLGKFNHSVYAVSISPDKRCVAIGTGADTAHVWDFEKACEVLCLRGHETMYVNGVSYSPDGCFIATGGSDGTVRIWDAVTGEELHCLRDHGNKVTNVAYSLDGERIASTGHDQTVRIWDSRTGSCIRILPLLTWRYFFNDLVAVATGPPQFPFLILFDGAETAILDYTSGESVGWFAGNLNATHPSGDLWCGSSDGHFCLVKLKHDGKHDCDSRK